MAGETGSWLNLKYWGWKWCKLRLKKKYVGKYRIKEDSDSGVRKWRNGILREHVYTVEGRVPGLQYRY